MNPVANIVGVSYVDIATTRMADLQATLDAVLAAELNVLNPILRALMLIYIATLFMLVMRGRVSMDRFVQSATRGLVIVFLVTHNGAFVQRIRNPVFDKIPQAMSDLVVGNFGALPSGQPMAARFDAVAAKSDAIAAEIDVVSNHWYKVSDWINSANAHTANGIFQLILAIIVGIWLLGQTLLAIVLALFLPMLCFELVERTRGFVDQLISKVVGMTAFGFATSFVLAFQIHGMETMFDGIKGHAADNTTAAVNLFWHVLGSGALDLLTMAVLPTAVGFGSGAVAALAMPSGMLVMRTLTFATGGMAAGATMAATALTRTTTGAANVMKRT